MKKLLSAFLFLFSSLAIAQSYPSPTYNNLSVNGTATIPHAAITGGTIDGAAIGATTPVSVAATTLSSTGLATLNGLTVTNAPTFSTPVPASSGGTGASTLTGYVYGNGTSSMSASPFIPCASALLGAACAVASNSALQSVSTAALPANSIIYRAGYTTVGDAGAMYYIPSASACSLNSGNGDNGSQVKSADNKCFIWQPSGMKVTPMVFGAAGNGMTDDTTAVKAALVALAGQPMYIGNYLYGISSTITTNSDIEGNGGGQGLYNSTCLSGFRILSGAFDAINPGRAGLNIRNICLDTAGGVTSTNGGVVEIGTHNSLTVEKSQFNNICKPIYLSGNGATQNVNSRILNNIIVPYNASGCAGISVGGSSTGGNTVDSIISGNEIYCNGSSATGMIFYDVGGAFIAKNDPYACSYGTKIIPGSGQYSEWLYFNSTVLGDTSTNNDLLIDPQASSFIYGLNFTDTWASSATGGDNVRIQNTGAIPNTSYQGIHFVHHRTYIRSTSSNGFTINSGTEVSIKDSIICANASNTGSGISLGATDVNIAIQNNMIGACDNSSGSLSTGITLPNGLNQIQITGNSLNTATTPIAYTETPSNQWLLANNLGVDDVIGSVATAASITLPINSTIKLTGTTSVSSIAGRWQKRSVTLITTGGAVSFTTGGSPGPVCTAYTSTQNVPILAMWDKAAACWYLK